MAFLASLLLVCTAAVLAFNPLSIRTLSTIAGSGVLNGPYNGTAGPTVATRWNLGLPNAIAVDTSLQNVYFTDARFGRLFMLTQDGNMVVLAGSGNSTPADFSEGPALSRSLVSPQSIAVNPVDDSIAVTDASARIRVSTYPFPGTLFTQSGNGTLGYQDASSGVSALYSINASVAYASSSLMYISDGNNHVLRMLDITTGFTHLVAGIPRRAGYNGDSPDALTSLLNSPGGVAVRQSDSLVVFVDTKNLRIRALNSTGGIITIAGTGSQGFNGDLLPGTSTNIGLPGGIAIDDDGWIYFSDMSTHRVRVVQVGGVVRTLIGNGLSGFAGDGAAASTGMLNSPMGLAYLPSASGGVSVVPGDQYAQLIVADRGNARIRSISFRIAPSSTATSSVSNTATPSPCAPCNCEATPFNTPSITPSPSALPSCAGASGVSYTQASGDVDGLLLLIEPGVRAESECAQICSCGVTGSSVPCGAYSWSPATAVCYLKSNISRVQLAVGGVGVGGRFVNNVGIRRDGSLLAPTPAPSLNVSQIAPQCLFGQQPQSTGVQPQEDALSFSEMTFYAIVAAAVISAFLAAVSVSALIVYRRRAAARTEAVVTDNAAVNKAPAGRSLNVQSSTNPIASRKVVMAHVQNELVSVANALIALNQREGLARQ